MVQSLYTTPNTQYTEWDKVKYFEHVQKELFEVYQIPYMNRNFKGIDEAIATDPRPAACILGPNPRDTYHKLRIERNNIVHQSQKPVDVKPIDMLRGLLKEKETIMNKLIKEMAELKAQIIHADSLRLIEEECARLSQYTSSVQYNQHWPSLRSNP